MRILLTLFLFIAPQILWGQSKKQYAARLYTLRSESSKIKNLSWVPRLMPVSKEINGKLQVYVVLKAKFKKSGWSLRSSGVNFRKSKDGSQLALVPVNEIRTDISFTADGPRGQRQRGAFVIHFPKYHNYHLERLKALRERKKFTAKKKRQLSKIKREEEEARKRVEEQALKLEENEELEEFQEEFVVEKRRGEIKNIKRHQASVGASLTSIGLSDIRATDYSALALAFKGSYNYQWKPKWRIGANAFITTFNISTEGGVSPLISSTEANEALFLGGNLRIGRSIFESGETSIYAHIGFYMLTMSVDNEAYGADRLSGLQGLISGSFKLTARRKITGYLKFSPVGVSGRSLSLSNNEIALGGGYFFAPNEAGSIWSLNFDFSTLKLSSISNIDSTLTEFSTTTFSVGPTYHF